MSIQNQINRITGEVSTQTELIGQVIDALTNVVIPSQGGGVELPTLTNEGTAGHLLSGKQLINSNCDIVTGAIPTRTASDLTASGATVTVPAGYYDLMTTKSVATATQATPSITVSTAGEITASSTQTAGYVSAGTKSATKQLTTQAAKTITPSKSSQTAVAKNVYTTGAVTVAAIPSQYITTTDATAAASEIFSGKTAYANGSKVTGTFTIDSELTTMESKIAQLSTILDSKAAGGSGDGASVETCSISLNTYGDMYVKYYVYTHLSDNGTITTSFVENSDKYVHPCVDLVDVICGSHIHVSFDALSVYITTDVHMFDTENFMVPATSGWYIIDLCGE